MTKIEIDGIEIVVDGEQIESPDEFWNEMLSICYTPDHTGLMTPEIQIVMGAIQKYGAKLISGDVLAYLNPPPGTVY